MGSRATTVLLLMIIGFCFVVCALVVLFHVLTS